MHEPEERWKAWHSHLVLLLLLLCPLYLILLFILRFLLCAIRMPICQRDCRPPGFVRTRK